MDTVKDLAARGFKGELKQGELLSGHCSLKVGGPSRLLAVAEDHKDLEILLRYLEGKNVPWMVLGGGTNTVFANGGYKGCVVKLGDGFSNIHMEEGSMMFAGAAAPLQALVARTGDEGLAGLECLAGIPGTVGGAVRMNAGTGSGEISSMLRQAKVYSRGCVNWRQKSELGFAYRSSGIRDGEIVLAARFGLARSAPDAVRSAISRQLARRRRTQPTGVPSAGCWFRNPEGDSAGRLIDEAGLKGARTGGASVSDVHANFLINTGGATAEDFLVLAGRIREAVRSRFGVQLVEEVQVIDG